MRIPFLARFLAKRTSPFRYMIVHCCGPSDAPDTELYIPDDPSFGKTTFSTYGDAVNRIVSTGNPTRAAPDENDHWLGVKDMKTGKVVY